MILIDMHMPKTCLECPIHDGEYGWCDLDADIAMNCDDRPDNCPLHEVTDPDTVSRQLGEWLPEYGNANARAYYCSACKFYYTTSPEKMNYCPHCGDPKKKMPFKVRSSKQTVIERWQKVFERRHTYCKDCERSIYGKYADCNANIENNGLYVRGNCECRFKVKKEREETDTFS